MGLSVQTNLAALNAANNLTKTQNQLAGSLQKLSSGFRINSAADDAAGLAISEGMRSQMGGIKVGIRNAQDGISVVQTAEGALNETTSILQRMRDLSVQGANGGALTHDASANIQTEITKLQTTLDNISTNTKFNGQSLLTGAYNQNFQVGANVGETVNVAVSTDASSTGLGVSAATVNVADQAGYVSGLKVGDAGTPATVATNTTSLSAGAQTTGIQAGAAATAVGAVTIGGVNVDTSSLTGTSTTGDLVGMINATAGLAGKATAALDGTGKIVVTSLTTGAAGKTDSVITGSAKLSIFGAPVVAGGAAAGPVADLAAVAANNLKSGAAGAVKAIDLIDKAIAKVSTERANLGATQNQFDHTINNANVALQNVTASESRIRDTDMAATMVDFTKSQILSQAGTAMLAQAKSLPQDVLTLLR